MKHLNKSKISSCSKEPEDYENGFECHAVDGITMGNIEKPKKGLSTSVFEEEKVGNVLLRGAEATERIAIYHPKMR